jgi:hypothetical protein
MSVHVAPKPGTRAFIDFEFNGRNGAILSAAIVTDTGKEWYEVMEYDTSTIVPWVAENVIPVLGKEPLSRAVFMDSFEMFIEQFGYIEFYFNAHADQRYLDELLAAVPNPPLHRCIRDGHMFAGHSVTPHNALADARAIVEYICGSAEANPALPDGPTSRDLFVALWKQGYRFDARDVVVSMESVTSYEGLPYAHRQLAELEAFQAGMSVMELIHGKGAKDGSRVFCEGRIRVLPRRTKSNAQIVALQGQVLIPFYFYRRTGI